MSNGVKVDQRKIDRRRIKCVGGKHPLGNEPLLAPFEDHAKMAFAMAMFLPQDNGGLSMERMIGITKLDDILITDSMLSLRSPDRRRCSPISPATPTASRLPTAA